MAVLLGGCMLGLRESPAAPAPVSTLAAEDWQEIAPGLERRVYRPPDSSLGQLEVLRIDPARYAFRAHYRPGEPLRITEWPDQLPGVVALVNANFFDPDHRVLGLLVADGVVYGTPYRDRGGIFAIQNGEARVRSTRREPYQGEPLEQAVQAFPLLVEDGRAAHPATGQDRVTRRTVIAQDSSGRILLMITPGLGLELGTLSAYLPTTDMNIVHAVNLDGGGSTMMYYYVPGMTVPFVLPSRDPVPSVLAIYTK